MNLQNRPLRLALADDQALVRSGLRALLQAQPNLDVTVEATCGDDLLKALMEQDVDLVLCDIRMPGVDGIEVVRRLRRGANRLPVILLTTFHEEQLLEQAVGAGANGFVLKDIEPEELTEVIKAVIKGEKHFAPQATGALRANANLPAPTPLRDSLDRHDLAVLRLMSAGLSNREIASRLHRAEGTIKNRVSTILHKLDARDRTQAVLKAITHGLI